MSISVYRLHNNQLWHSKLEQRKYATHEGETYGLCQSWLLTFQDYLRNVNWHGRAEWQTDLLEGLHPWVLSEHVKIQKGWVR